MTNVNISIAKAKLFDLAHSCIRFDDAFNISTKDGNIILISEKEYNNIIESLRLASTKGVYECIENAVNTQTYEMAKVAPWEK